MNETAAGTQPAATASPRPVRGARTLFPGAELSTYLDVSVRGLLSDPVRQAVDRYLDVRQSGTGAKSELLDRVEHTRGQVARLLGAGVDEIAFTKNASDGISMIAAALPWERGDNVVLCSDLEHPNNVFPWYNLHRRFGVEVRAVAPRDGHVPSEEMAAVMDARTRLVTVPTISFSPGFLTDLEPLATACRESGAFFLVDAAQSVGVVRTDVEEMGVDALAFATQKGLCAFYGQGFLYCREGWAERIQPAYLARYGVDLGDAHETALGASDFRYGRGARRFDLGNYNYLGVTAASAAIDLLDQFGVDAIEAYDRGLAARLADGLLALGLPVAGGVPGPHLAHIVAVGETGGGRHDSADDPAMNDLHRHPVENGVQLAIRRGVLRLSVHLYNHEDDVDRVVGLAREWVDGPGASVS